jgi:hypothetical protein
MKATFIKPTEEGAMDVKDLKEKMDKLVSK